MHADTRHPAPELAACSGVLTLELNTGPAGSVPPGPVSRASATQIAEGIAADLGRLVPDLARFALVVPGALYDQTELLRPGFPLLAALDDVFRGTLLDGGFVPGLVALGSDDGRAFTLPALNPARQPGAGPLLMLPFSLLGRPGDITELSMQLENSLLQSGGVSVTTRQAVEAAFGLRAVNLSYATVGDLCALLKVQLEHAGFDGLWELLERALFRPQEPADVSLAPGNRFLMSEGTVWTPFWTFDDWAQIGPGQERPADALAAGYVEWVRTQRQYLMALSAWACRCAWRSAKPSPNAPARRCATCAPAPRSTGIIWSRPCCTSTTPARSAGCWSPTSSTTRSARSRTRSPRSMPTAACSRSNTTIRCRRAGWRRSPRA